MKQKFEKLANLKKCKKIESDFLDGFISRNAERELKYEVMERNQSPNSQFYERSYDI